MLCHSAASLALWGFLGEDEFVEQLMRCGRDAGEAIWQVMHSTMDKWNPSKGEPVLVEPLGPE